MSNNDLKDVDMYSRVNSHNGVGISVATLFSLMSGITSANPEAHDNEDGTISFTWGLDDQIEIVLDDKNQVVRYAPFPFWE
jgi:hypothetical protein